MVAIWAIAYIASGLLAGWLVAGEMGNITNGHAIKPWVGVGILLVICHALFPKRAEKHFYSFFIVSALATFLYFYWAHLPSTFEEALRTLRGFSIALGTVMIFIGMSKVYAYSHPD